MALFPVFLSFAAVLFLFFPVNGQEPSIESLSTSLSKNQMEIVNSHNECRRTVIPPATNMVKMSWDHEAMKTAQNWAYKCVWKHSPHELRKTNTSSCGENIFKSGNPVTWKTVINNWNAEKQSFKYGVGPKTPGAMIGHYTQVVWYSSSRVGCAFAYCPNEQLKYYYVCHYCPAGNLQRKKHVPYLSGTQCAACPNDCDNGLCTNSCILENKYRNCASLVNQVGCDHELTKNNCKAQCKCKNKIY